MAKAKSRKAKAKSRRAKAQREQQVSRVRATARTLRVSLTRWQVFPLLDLPPELWIKIGKIAIDCGLKLGCWPYREDVVLLLKQAPITRVCNLLRLELLPYFYGEQLRLLLSVPDNLSRWADWHGIAFTVEFDVGQGRKATRPQDYVAGELVYGVRFRCLRKALLLHMICPPAQGTNGIMLMYKMIDG